MLGASWALCSPPGQRPRIRADHRPSYEPVAIPPPLPRAPGRRHHPARIVDRRRRSRCERHGLRSLSRTSASSAGADDAAVAVASYERRSWTRAGHAGESAAGTRSLVTALVDGIEPGRSRQPVRHRRRRRTGRTRARHAVGRGRGRSPVRGRSGHHPGRGHRSHRAVTSVYARGRPAPSARSKRVAMPRAAARGTARVPGPANTSLAPLGYGVRGHGVATLGRRTPRAARWSCGRGATSRPSIDVTRRCLRAAALRRTARLRATVPTPWPVSRSTPCPSRAASSPACTCSPGAGGVTRPSRAGHASRGPSTVLTPDTAHTGASRLALTGAPPVSAAADRCSAGGHSERCRSAPRRPGPPAGGPGPCARRTPRAAGAASPGARRSAASTVCAGSMRLV